MATSAAEMSTRLACRGQRRDGFVSSPGDRQIGSTAKNAENAKENLSMKDLQSLCAQVRQTAYDIHLYRFEMRKFDWSQDGTCRESKPTFLLSAVSAFFAFFAV
jgi:hypothetical protein